MPTATAVATTLTRSTAMPTTHYNALADLGLDGVPGDDLVDALIDYHPAIARSTRGTLEAIITLPAESLRQAALTALAVCEHATGREPRAVQVMTTEDFDAL